MILCKLYIEGARQKMRLDITKLKIAMIRKKMNQNKLSELSGVNKTTISLLMTQKQRGSIQTWEKLARALDVHVFELTAEESNE